jgi:hypothetical protein
MKKSKSSSGGSEELPADIHERVVADFGIEQAEAIYRHLLGRIPEGLPNGARPRHLRCILHLADGDRERLDEYIEMCLTDPRDVMVHAEDERPYGASLKRLRDFSKPFGEAERRRKP